MMRWHNSLLHALAREIVRDLPVRYLRARQGKLILCRRPECELDPMQPLLVLQLAGDELHFLIGRSWQINNFGYTMQKVVQQDLLVTGDKVFDRLFCAILLADPDCIEIARTQLRLVLAGPPIASSNYLDYGD